MVPGLGTALQPSPATTALPGAVVQLGTCQQSPGRARENTRTGTSRLKFQCWPRRVASQACESEQQYVVILVRNLEQSQLDLGNMC